MHFAFLLKSLSKVSMVFFFLCVCYISTNKSPTLYISFSTWDFLSSKLTLRDKVWDTLQSQTKRVKSSIRSTCYRKLFSKVT